jgi:rubrerythrin
VTAQDNPAFSDLEALKMAQGMEKEGLAFYRNAEAAVASEQLKSTFSLLAGEEEDHLKTFEDIAGELARSKTEEYWDEPDVDAYVRAVVSQTVFPRPELASGAVAGMAVAADALRFALQAEKDTVLYYSLCAEKAKAAQVREAFYKLVAEERKHVVLIGKLLKEASG